VVDAKASGLIWTALSWSAVASQQAQRARADWEHSGNSSRL
jgi:hypothetical protein